MKLFYTHQALHDLERLRVFIAKENSSAANKIAVRLKKAIQRLVKFPELGKEVKQDHEQGVLRDLITGKYVVRYLILKNEIHILRLWHGKEDLYNAS